jgi:hypothetical protein
MSETETPAAATPGPASAAPDSPAASNGRARQSRPPRIVKPAEPEPCADCEPSRGATGLGLLLCAVAGGLLFIGLDLISGGGLTRRLAGVPEGDGDAS